MTPLVETTTDYRDKRIGFERSFNQVGPDKVYAILPQFPEEFRARAWVRPLRGSYRHIFGPAPCGNPTIISKSIAETFARDPVFYRMAYCQHCLKHFMSNNFTWEPDGATVGS